MPPEQIDGVDIEVMDLLCAEGLRGSEDLNVQKCLDSMDSLAKLVEWETKRNFHRFQEHPEEYHGSLAYYRMGMLGTILSEDYGMRYNPDQEIPWLHGKRPKEEAIYADAKDIFIHGLLGGKRYGTCASMPVLYVAISRRLGYPVNLAATKYHLYARYEQEDGGHLNVEGTENWGFTRPTDEEYRKGPFPSTDQQIRELGWLKPMTGGEMLAAFLFKRAGCLRSMKRHEEEAEAIRQASRYMPETLLARKIIQANLDRAQNLKLAQKWDDLWSEVDQMYVPPESQFAEFQNRKVQMHLLMNHSTDLAEVETAVAGLRRDLAEYQSRVIGHRDGAPQAKPVETALSVRVLRLTVAPGGTISIPAERLPPFESGRIPASLLEQVYASGMDNGQAILAAFWKQYEAEMLGRQNASSAQDLRESVLMASAPPRRLLLPQEKIPCDYWSGLPQDLQQRVRVLGSDQDIIEELNLYAAEEMQLRSLGGPASTSSLEIDPFMPPGWKLQEHIKLNAFARQIGVPAGRIPLSYQNREMPPELQKRILAKTRYMNSSKDTVVLEEFQRFDSEQLPHQQVVDAIHQRRRLLEQMQIVQPPLQIQVVRSAERDTTAPDLHSISHLTNQIKTQQ